MWNLADSKGQLSHVILFETWASGVLVWVVLEPTFWGHQVPQYSPKQRCVCVYVLVTQSCLTLCDLIGYSLPGSSVHGILQARILEWSGLPFPSPGDLPDPGIKPLSPALQADFYHLSHQGRTPKQRKLFGNLAIREQQRLIFAFKAIPARLPSPHPFNKKG